MGEKLTADPMSSRGPAASEKEDLHPATRNILRSLHKRNILGALLAPHRLHPSSTRLLVLNRLISNDRLHRSRHL